MARFLHPTVLPRLQTRIGLALGALILGLALVLAAVFARTAQTQVLRLSAANLESLSAQMARELSGGMDRFAQAVVTQTSRDRFRDPASPVPAMRKALDQFKQTNPEFAYVSIVDAGSARVVAASGGIFEGGNAAGRPTYEQGLKGPFVGDVHDAVRLAELLPKPQDGEPLRFLDVAAPIVDDQGRVVRVFATHVSWQWTEQVRRDIFGPLRDSLQVDAFLLDSTGKVVLAGSTAVKVGTALPAIAAAGGAHATEMIWPDGARYLTAVTLAAPHGQFPGFGWKVVARQPLEVAAAASDSLRSAFLFGALALGLGGAALAWFIAGRLVRPVRLLAEAASQLQAGMAAAAPPPQLAARLSASLAAQSAAFSAGGSAVAEVSAVHEAIAQLADNARIEAQASAISKRQFAVLAASLPQAVFQADAAGAIVDVNAGWMRDAAVRGTGSFTVGDLQALLVDGDSAAFAAAWRASLASQTGLQLRCRVRRPGTAEAHWCDIEAHAVTDDAGAVTGWVGTLCDVHEMVTRAEETERALVSERAARLQAERLARMRDEFLATVSHELRSPLSCITGWSDVLRLKGDGNPMVMKAAEVIRRNAALQAGLINDLLDITAVMAGKLVISTETLELARIAGEVVLSHLRAAQTKGVELKCLNHREGQQPLMIDADRRRITQVLSNLVGNAIKFTDAGGRIQVAVGADPHDASQALVEVRDSGRGIAPDFLPHVFERLRQEDSSATRRAGGLGLGLAIVHGLVALHRGSVSADSAGIGHGAVFSVRLPLAADALPAGPAPTADEADGAGPVIELLGRRVLLVDDEADAREVAHVALSSLGADVRLAASGAEVLQILQTERFDVFVSDIGMPGMDGLTLLKKVRALPRGGADELPAVALTAFAMESDRQAGMRAGFQAYVAKPISLRRLSEAVAEALDLHVQAEAGR